MMIPESDGAIVLFLIAEALLTAALIWLIWF